MVYASRSVVLFEKAVSTPSKRNAPTHNIKARVVYIANRVFHKDENRIKIMNERGFV